MAIPAHGHVNPSLSLVAELVRRGHRVTYAITDDFAELVRTAGADVVPYDSTVLALIGRAASDVVDQQVIDMEEMILGAHRMFYDEFVAVTPQIEAAYADDRPDMIVYDVAAWQGPLLAAKWGIPAIQLAPTFVPYEGMSEDYGVDSTADPSPGRVALTAEFDEFVASHGVRLTWDELLREPKRSVVTIAKSWQFKGDTLPDSFTFVGPSVDTRDNGQWAAPDERPVLLISLGSVFTHRLDFYRECVRAFADLDWHVLLQVGKHVDPADLGEVPANFSVVQWVPQVSVLAQARAFVTHAGMGSTMEGLYFGVPMVAVPQAFDQHLNGARLAELGLGVHLPMAEVTAEALRAAVERVTSDPDIAAKIKSVRDEVRAAGGASAAADVVESYA
jgi:MGT family glycosyltransferase